MINKKIDELFKSINDSKEYQEYISILNVLKQDEDLVNLIDEIKVLQKKATMLEYNKDEEYKNVDTIIKEKVNILNNNPLYLEYKNKMDNLNDILSMSSDILQKYIDDIV